MNFKRRINRAQLPKEPHHCGMPMMYKESHGDWICQKCGKIKHKPKGADNEDDQSMDPRNGSGR